MLNVARDILIIQNKFETDALKTVSKRSIQNTAEATGDLIKLLIQLQSPKKIYNKIIQSQLKLRMIKQYLNKDILQRKNKKLLIIYNNSQNIWD